MHYEISIVSDKTLTLAELIGNREEIMHLSKFPTNRNL